jgi:hypothetical protein
MPGWMRGIGGSGFLCRLHPFGSPCFGWILRQMWMGQEVSREEVTAEWLTEILKAPWVSSHGIHVVRLKCDDPLPGTFSHS